MASTFVLKRKTFDDSGEKKNSGWGKKLAIGAGTVAATAGLAYGAKKGLMGNNIMLKTNRGLNKVGNAISSIGDKHNFGSLSSFGNKLTNSGAQDAATARVNMIEKRLQKTKGSDFKLTSAQRENAWNKRFNVELGHYGGAERATAVKNQNLATSNAAANYENYHTSDGVIMR
jgi:hypothetical protein